MHLRLHRSRSLVSWASRQTAAAAQETAAAAEETAAAASDEDMTLLELLEEARKEEEAAKYDGPPARLLELLEAAELEDSDDELEYLTGAELLLSAHCRYLPSSLLQGNMYKKRNDTN